MDDPERCRQKRFSELRKEIAIGIEQADRGEAGSLRAKAINAQRLRLSGARTGKPRAGP